MSDYISRQAAIACAPVGARPKDIRKRLKELPSADVPDVVCCKDCVKHNIGENDTPYLSQICPLVKIRGKAQGHEFDYQYCVYGKRKDTC